MSEEKNILPKAVIVDIDGTIASRNERSPYDMTRVVEDAPVPQIIQLVKILAENGYKIIFVSGRTEDGRQETDRWFMYHMPESIDTSILYMRKVGDNRNDAVVKKEIYLEHIHDKYDVLLTIDDRDRVVSMWRTELGLTCLQVNYGNF